MAAVEPTPVVDPASDLAVVEKLPVEEVEPRQASKGKKVKMEKEKKVKEAKVKEPKATSEKVPKLAASHPTYMMVSLIRPH